MNKARIIGRLDIKGPNLIKGIHLEGLRVIGNPKLIAKKYYDQGIDELIYIDTVASLYGRNNLQNIVKNAAQDIFVPLTVGGGIRSIDDALNIFKIGADKVAINTAAVKRPELIKEIALKFGSQAMVISIEAKKNPSGWEVYTDNGREKTGLDVIAWTQNCVDLGAGEILITSIDKEGTRLGFDLDLIEAVSRSVKVPIIASGGLGSPNDLVDAIIKSKADAVAVADFLHYNRGTVSDLKNEAKLASIKVRMI